MPDDCAGDQCALSFCVAFGESPVLCGSRSAFGGGDRISSGFDFYAAPHSAERAHCVAAGLAAAGCGRHSWRFINLYRHPACRMAAAVSAHRRVSSRLRVFVLRLGRGDRLSCGRLACGVAARRVAEISLRCIETALWGPASG